MHHVGTNKKYGERAWRQLHKIAASCIEQIREATPDKTVAVRPPTTHHKPDMRDTAGTVKTNS